MTDSQIKIHGKVVAILGGYTIIGFCLFFCSITIYSVFDGAFGSMGGLLGLLMVPFAAYIAFGFCRYLSFTNNPSEAWGVLACFLSAFTICVSGTIVSYLEGTFYPDEAEYRSINLDGHSLLFTMIYMPLFMVWFCRILQMIVGYFSNSSTDSAPSKRRPLLPFIKKYWKYDLCITVLFCVVFTVSGFMLLVFDPPLPLSENNLTHDEFYRKADFPFDGSDFCYKRTNSWFECDFTLSEESYLRWVKTHEDWSIRDISHDEPIEISQLYSEIPIRVNDGFVADNNQNEKRNIFERVVFDRGKNKVYYTFCVI